MVLNWTAREYGVQGETQYVKVYVPERVGKPEEYRFPVAVFVHGGFWKNEYSVDYEEHAAVALDLCNRGFVAVAVEYRRRDHIGGGYPGSNLDVLNAVNFLRNLREEGVPLDESRVVLIGHSAGATLVLWYASQALLGSGFLRPKVVVAMAPVTDLEAAYIANLGGDAIVGYMKCSPEEIENDDAVQKYRKASPLFLPLNRHIPLLIVGAEHDEDVPYAMARSFFDRVCKLIDVDDLRMKRHTLTESALMTENCGHMDLVNVEHESWKRVCDRLVTYLTPDRIERKEGEGG